MIDKALTAIQRTGLYPTAILEYQAFATENKNWAEFKTHFAEAYMVRLQSGQSGGNPYHGATNSYENDDNDSINTLHNTLANLTHESNANTNELNKNISSMAHEMTALRTTVGQHAQQLANIATTPTVANPEWSAPPTWAAPPSVPTNIYLNPGATNPYTPSQIANFAPTITTPATAGIPPPVHAGRGRGRGRRRGGRGRGGARFNKNQSAYGREQPTTGGNVVGGVAQNNP